MQFEKPPSHTAVSIWTLFIVFVCTSICTAATPLKYQFKDTPQATYSVSIQADYPDYIESSTGILTYRIASVDPDNGQIRLSCSSQMRQQRQDKHPDDHSGRMPFPRPPMPPAPPNPFAPARPSPDIMISPDGSILQSNSTDDDSQLPHMLGYAWQLMIVPLPTDGAAHWNSERSLSVFTKSERPQEWPAPPPWQRQPETRVDRPAKEAITFASGASDGTTATVDEDYELVTDEKVGDNPVLRKIGKGKFIFDTTAGLVRSMEMNYTIEINEENVTLRIPVKVEAKLLTAEELAEIKAKREAALAQARATVEHARAADEARQAAHRSNLTSLAAPPEAAAFPEKPGSGSVVDLLKTEKTATRGDWKMTAGELSTDGRGFEILSLGFQPPAEYDLEMDFTRETGDEDIALALHANNSTFTFVMGGWHNSIIGAEQMNGTRANGMPESITGQDLIPRDQREHLILHVRKDGLQATVAGQSYHVSTDFSGWSINSDWSSADGQSLSLMTLNSSVVFHSIKLTVVSGEGQRLK